MELQTQIQIFKIHIFKTVKQTKQMTKHFTNLSIIIFFSLMMLSAARLTGSHRVGGSSCRETVLKLVLAA